MNTILNEKQEVVLHVLDVLEPVYLMSPRIELMEKLSTAKNDEEIEAIFDHFMKFKGYMGNVLIKITNLDKTHLINISRMEIAPDYSGNPVMQVTEVVNHYETVLYWFPLKNGLDIHLCNVFLRSLNLGINIRFENYRQYGELIHQCSTLLDARKAAAVVCQQ